MLLLSKELVMMVLVMIGCSSNVIVCNRKEQLISPTCICNILQFSTAVNVDNF